MAYDLRAQIQYTLGGAFRVDEELGSGGMSRVFAATDAQLGRRVVVKVLPPELAAGVGIERFKREMHVAARLLHPNIVPVLSAGESSDFLYYTMPLIAGETLRAVLQRERQLPLDDALRFATDIASALACAHAHNVVHRDIKPENVLVENGRALVTDFGIARAIERAADTVSVTSTGLTLGTPTYMSPEQAAAEKAIDGRSDIYSLGCVLYEMLVGEPPFTGADARIVIARHLHQPAPSVLAARPDLPEHVARAVATALAKAPADRFATASGFIAALYQPGSGALAAADPCAPPARRVPHVSTGVLAGSMIATAALAFTMFVARRVTGGQAASAPGAIAAVATGVDARHVAVLPFDAPPHDAELALVARGIGADLITSLRTPDLRIVSEYGTERFGPRADPGAVSRALDVGTLVYGSVEAGADARAGVRVTVKLVGPDAVERARVVVTSPRRAALALRDSVVTYVADTLRRLLGEDVRLLRWRSEASSDSAWRLREQAAQLARHARDRSAGGAPEESEAAYARADALLARAIALDPRWTGLLVERGWVAFGRSRNTGDAAARARLLDSAVANAQRALQRRPLDAAALELRGVARAEQWQWDAGGPTWTRDSAEADLRAATTADPTLATGWATYSLLLQRRGDARGAIDAARRAVAADPYRRDVVPALLRLIMADLALGKDSEANALCATGRQHFPGDPIMGACELNVLGYTGAGTAATRRAWTILREEEDSIGLYAHVAGILPFGRFYVAAILGRSGLRDSALSVVADTRARLRAAGQDTAGRIAQAYAWTTLGAQDSALSLLTSAIAANPSEREVVARLPWFRALAREPRFVRLVHGAARTE